LAVGVLGVAMFGAAAFVAGVAGTAGAAVGAGDATLGEGIAAGLVAAEFGGVVAGGVAPCANAGFGCAAIKSAAARAPANATRATRRDRHRTRPSPVRRTQRFVCITYGPVTASPVRRPAKSARPLPTVLGEYEVFM
jgi:hypothetical protein